VLRGGDDVAVGRVALEDGVEGIDIRQMDLADGVGNPIGSGTGTSNPNGVNIAQGKQDKHIPGTNNYAQEIVNGKPRSILLEDPQQLLDDFAGTGQKVGNNKERIDFGKVIGQYYNPQTNTYVDTTRGLIHYDSKGGAHIVPSTPN
jgi:hypothetical protein